jgi:hypothetical protein
MSQSEFALVGEALAAGINAAFPEISTAAHARKTYAELPALSEDGWRIDVVQKEERTEAADRTSRRHLYVFDVVFRRRFSRQASEVTAIDPLDETVELASDELYGLDINISGNAVECVETHRPTPFDPECLSKGVFLSVINGTWTVDR